MGLPRLVPKQVRRILEGCVRIKDKEGGGTVPWRFNDGQWKTCQSSLEDGAARFQIHGKPRQIGLSLYFDAEDVLWTNAMNAARNPVRTVILLDTAPKAAHQVDRCEAIAKQLRLPVERKAASARGPERLVWKGGSEIWAFSADSNRVGASYDIDRLHISETPYFKRPFNTFGSIMQSLSDRGIARIETTVNAMDVLVRTLWYEAPEWATHFVSVEDVQRFRRDPDELSADAWALLQEQGYANRAAAAWFEHAVLNLFGGDRNQAFNEYPQLPSHMFQLASGLWVQGTPPFRKPVRVLTVEGEQEDWRLLIYKEPRPGRSYVIGVDTAEGVGRDKSVVSVIDEETEEHVALFSSSLILSDDLALVAKAAQETFTTIAKGRWSFLGHVQPKHTPFMVVEKNGVGSATLLACQRLGLHCVGLNMDAGIRRECLTRSRRAIEAGKIVGNMDLIEECDHLHVDPITGKFKGPKDILMALGMALRTADRVRPPEQDEPDETYAEQRLRAIRAAAQERRWR